MDVFITGFCVLFNRIAVDLVCTVVDGFGRAIVVTGITSSFLVMNCGLVESPLVDACVCGRILRCTKTACCRPPLVTACLTTLDGAAVVDDVDVVVVDEPDGLMTRSCSVPPTWTARKFGLRSLMTFPIELVAFDSVVVAPITVVVVLLLPPLFDGNKIFCDANALTPLFKMVGGPLADATVVVVVPVAETVAGAMGVGLVPDTELVLFAVAADTNSFSLADVIKPICWNCEAVSVRVLPPLAMVFVVAVVEFDAALVAIPADVRIIDELPRFTMKRRFVAPDVGLFVVATDVVGVGAIDFGMDTTFLFFICRILPSNVLINCMADVPPPLPAAPTDALALFTVAAVAF